MAVVNDINITFSPSADPINIVFQTGLQGVAGQAGADGSKILTGNGVPNPIDGNPTDIYINLLNYDLYQKDATVWNLIGNISGA